MAASAAFYGLLSIPPLLLGLVATAAIIAIAMGPDVVDRLSDQLLSIVGKAFSPQTTADVVRPTIDRVLREPSPGILSVGYAAAIWSASRMVNAVLLGIEVLTDQDAERSDLRTRLLSIKALVLGLVAITVVLPLLAIGPAKVLGFLGASPVLVALGWVLAALIGVGAVTLFLRAAIPAHPPWRLAGLGAVLTLAGWAVGSVALQAWTARATSGPSLYGPLSAPIAVLLWLQLLAMVTFAAAALIAALGRRAEAGERGST